MIKAAHEWPTTPHDIACRIVRSHDRAEINLLLGSLRPYLYNVSRKIARLTGVDVREFCADAFADIGRNLSGHVCEGEPRRTFDPNRGIRFSTWAHRVIRNKAIREAQRKRRRSSCLQLGEQHAKLAELAADAKSFETILQVDQLLEGPRCLNAIDFDVVESWPPITRLTLIALSGLYACIAYQDWERWKGQVGCAGLSIIDTVENFPTAADRQRPLAELIGVAPNTVTARWRRNNVLLFDVELVWSSIRDRVPEFHPDQSDEVSQWPSLAAIVLLATTGLWIRLPSWRLWRRWCRAARITTPIPLLTMQGKPTHSERLAWLGNWMTKRKYLDEPGDVGEIWEENHRLLARIGHSSTAPPSQQ